LFGKGFTVLFNRQTRRVWQWPNPFAIRELDPALVPADSSVGIVALNLTPLKLAVISVY